MLSCLMFIVRTLGLILKVVKITSYLVRLYGFMIFDEVFDPDYRQELSLVGSP